MKKLVLIGGGGHCKSVLDTVLRVKEYDEVVITDERLERGSTILGCRVAGTDVSLEELREKGFDNAFVTVGSIKDTAPRKRLAELALSLGYTFPVIIDPSAAVSGFSDIGQGTFVGKNVVVNADVKIGRHCILNTGAVIEHECVVEDFVHISVGAILCGNVHVREEAFVGAGSTVIQGVTLGRGSVTGANSTVLADIGDNQTVYGTVKGE